MSVSNFTLWATIYITKSIDSGFYSYSKNLFGTCGEVHDSWQWENIQMRRVIHSTLAISSTLG